MQQLVLSIKALLGAFIVFALLQTAAASCVLSGSPRAIEVVGVSDGDTLRLRGGRRLRLLGINASELAHEPGQYDEALARAAQAKLRAYAQSGALSWRADSVGEDRFGRLLGQVVLADGRDPAAELLRAGLATSLFLPPNFSLAPCYRALEIQAQRAKLGLWALPAYQRQTARQVDLAKSAYLRVQGRLTQRIRTRYDELLWLDDRLLIKVERALLDQDPLLAQSLQKGRPLAVFGRLQSDAKGAHLRLRSRYQIEDI